MELFRAEHITRQFSEKFVLSNFSFSVSSGDKLKIAGRSGIGKTTLFRLLLGFDRPDQGTIYFEGEPLTEEQAWIVRRKVAYVSQDLNIGRGKVNQFFDDTLSLKANHSFRKQSEQKLPGYLDLLHLPNTVLDKNIEELSGGERQRVAIVNALLLNRTIFFLDEVSSALDPVLKTVVLDYFLSNPDFTVLYISHDQYESTHSAIKTLQLHDYE